MDPASWAEVLAGRARPVPHPFHVIASYLRTKGHAINGHQVRDHFTNHEEAR
jgi:hypothetical protein